MNKPLILPKEVAYRFGQLSERFKLLQHQCVSTAEEQARLLAEYEIQALSVQIITEPGGKYPVGSVIDHQTGLPVMIAEKSNQDSQSASPEEAPS